MIGTDGRLRLPMDRINTFCAANKGKRVTVRFEAAAPGSTKAQQSYFYQYVLPTVQQAYRETGERMSEEWTERVLFLEYPEHPRKENGNPAEHARDLNQTQMSDFLEWLKQFAAENLSVYIEDPRTI